jgi:hypothetical protein
MIVDIPSATVSPTLSRNNKRGLNLPIHGLRHVPQMQSGTPIPSENPPAYESAIGGTITGTPPSARYLGTVWMELMYRIISTCSSRVSLARLSTLSRCSASTGKEREPTGRTAKGPTTDDHGWPATRVRRDGVRVGPDGVSLSGPAHGGGRRFTVASRSPTDGVPPDGYARPGYAVRVSRCVVLFFFIPMRCDDELMCFALCIARPGVLAAIIWFPLGIALCLLDRRVKCERCGETLEDGLCS